MGEDAYESPTFDLSMKRHSDSTAVFVQKSHVRAPLAGELEAYSLKRLDQLRSRYDREASAHPARRLGVVRLTSMGMMAGDGSTSLRSSPS